MSEIKPVSIEEHVAIVQQRASGNPRMTWEVKANFKMEEDDILYPAAALEALQAANAAQAKRIAELEENRNRLVVSIHSLASNFENVLGVLSKDDEALKKAIGDINHAKKVAAQNRG